MSLGIDRWRRADSTSRPTEVILDASFVLTLYSIEENEARDRCRQFFDQELSGKVAVYVSEWVVNEAIYKTEEAFKKIIKNDPSQITKKTALLGQLMHFFNQRTRPLVPNPAQTLAIRRTAAQLRSDHGSRLGVTDTYIVATGLEMQKPHMVGSDRKWGDVDAVRFWRMPRATFVAVQE